MFSRQLELPGFFQGFLRSIILWFMQPSRLRIDNAPFVPNQQILSTVFSLRQFLPQARGGRIQSAPFFWKEQN